MENFQRGSLPRSPHGPCQELEQGSLRGRSCFAALEVQKLQVQLLVLDLIPVTSLVTESHLLPAAEEGGNGTLWLECTLGH